MRKNESVRNLALQTQKPRREDSIEQMPNQALKIIIKLYIPLFPDWNYGVRCAGRATLLSKMLKSVRREGNRRKSLELARSGMRVLLPDRDWEMDFGILKPFV